MVSGAFRDFKRNFWESQKHFNMVSWVFKGGMKEVPKNIRELQERLRRLSEGFEGVLRLQRVPKS